MKKIIITIIPLFLFLSACEKSSDYRSQSEPAYTSDKSVEQPQNTGGGGGGRMENQPAAPTQQISLDQAANNQSQPTVTERKIIRNAELKIEANSPEESQQKIAQIAQSKNGFVIETNQTSSSNVQTASRDTVNMTIRVPAEKFDEAVTEIRASGNRVIQENVKGQDVTEEFIDIEARIKTQRALEQQFLEIMKRATTVEDTLNVQRELAQVRGEIERIEGRRRFLENQSSLSTIKIQLQTPTSLSANPTGFYYQLKEALSTGFNAALNVVLFLITAVIALLPFLLLIVLPLYLLLRHFWRKRIRLHKTVDTIVNEEIKSK